MNIKHRIARFLVLPLSAFCQWSVQVRDSAMSCYGVSIDFVDALHGWVAGNGLISITLDGGNSWDAASLDSVNDVRTIDFVDAKTGWVCGERIRMEKLERQAVILKSVDGGRRWSPCFESRWIPFTAGDTLEFSTLFFHDTDVGWAAFTNGLIYKTDNGGRDWTVQNIHSRGISSLFFLDPDTGWATVFGGMDNVPPTSIFRTSDGGASWIRQYSFTEWSDDILCSFFIDAKFGWVGGKYGRVYRTEDGGRTWIGPIQLGTAFVHRLFFKDRKTGWAAGYGNTISKTADAGDTWKRQTAWEEFNSIIDLKFVNEDVGWAYGSEGILLKTLNGGEPNPSASEQYKVPSQESCAISSFPNPFNPYTVIRYSISRASFVRMVLYNIRGEQVAVLSEGEKSPGTHETRLGSERLSSGIYFILAQVDERLLKTKIICAK